MAKEQKDLGRLVTVYGIAPAYLQRAVFLAVLSFMFFLTMMFAFYVRQSILYFLLSTAFLIVYLITMFSWVMQSKGSVELFENGFRYRKKSVLWDEVRQVGDKGEVEYGKGSTITLPSTLSRFDELIATIKARATP